MLADDIPIIVIMFGSAYLFFKVSWWLIGGLIPPLSVMQAHAEKRELEAKQKLATQLQEINPRLDIIVCSDCSKHKAKENCQACNKPLCLKCIFSLLVICKSKNPNYTDFPIQTIRCKSCTDRNNVSYVAKYL